MPKNDAQRITDALNYLQNTVLVTAAERAEAHQLAQDFVNAALNNPASAAYQQFSTNLSLGAHILLDPSERRKMARSLFMLWSAMRHFDASFPMPYPDASQIPEGTVREALISYIRKARCMYEILHGGNAGANHVITQVMPANPLHFLWHNKVIVYGVSFLDPAQAPQNCLPCKFEYNAYKDRYEFTVRQAAGAGGVNIQVESVTAFHWTDQRYVPRPVPSPPLVIGNTNFGQMTGIELSGNHTMVTTQFTGCAFSMGEHNGHMYCAHVSPAGVPNMAPNTDGNTLAQRVMVNGAFANAGGIAVRVYGRNVGSVPNARGYDIGIGGDANNYMTIIGFPGGASYHLFSQTTRNAAIKDARRII